MDLKIRNDLRYYLISTLIVLCGCGEIFINGKEDARIFNQKMINIYSPVFEDFNQLLNASSKITKYEDYGESVENFKTELNRVNSRIDEKIATVKSIEEFDEDIRFKEATLKFIEGCKVIINDNIAVLVELQHVGMTLEDYEKSWILLLEINREMIEYEKEINDTQSRFADKYFLEKVEYRNLDELEKQYEREKTEFERLINETVE